MQPLFRRNAIVRGIALGAMVAMLGACVSSRGIKPSGQLIEAGTLQPRQSVAEVAVSPAAWPQQDWWRALGDPQLDDLIDEALRDNPGLAQADALARQAQAQVQALNATRGPQAELDLSALGARLSEKEAGLVLPEATGTFAWMKTAEMNFSWGLDLWGGKRAAWEAALGRDRAAEVDRRAARIQLSVNVAQAYIQLRQAFVLRDIAERDRARIHQIVELTRTYIHSGLGNPDSVHQLNTEEGVAEQREAQAEEAIDAARISLAVLLGKGPDRGWRIQPPAQLKPVSLAIPPDLAVNLLGRRPDLVAARWRVEAARRDIKAAKAQFLPNISISAMAGFVALGDNVDTFQLPARTFSIGPALSLPIFDGGRLRAGLQARDAQYDEAVAQYNQTVVRAVNQVADLLSAARSVQVQLKIEQGVIANAQHSLDDALVRYQAGLGTELDTLIVRQQLLVAEQNQAVLQSHRADLAVRLVEALGGGYQGGSEAGASTSATSPNRPAAP